MDKLPTKLKTPSEPKTIKLDNLVVYWADPMLSVVSDTVEEEYDLNVGNQLKYEGGFEFTNVKFITSVPLLKWNTGVNYEILFFDWGGMSYGNSMLESFCDNIIEEAIDNPNKIYVMCSRMTTQAMDEALSVMKDMPPNVLLSVLEFIGFFKRELKKEV